jgi:hypothetical protein
VCVCVCVYAYVRMCVCVCVCVCVSECGRVESSPEILVFSPKSNAVARTLLAAHDHMCLLGAHMRTPTPILINTGVLPPHLLRVLRVR